MCVPSLTEEIRAAGDFNLHCIQNKDNIVYEYALWI